MIKMFEQYNEYNQVKEWLDKMGIENYTINDDLTVDVEGSVYIGRNNLTEIPIQFGTIESNFVCMENELTTLKGCPKYVGQYFSCMFNNLTTLEFFPIHIGDGVNYHHNPLPQEILNFWDIKTFAKYQDEYAVWNSDGSFNKGRWDIFIKDYENESLGND